MIYLDSSAVMKLVRSENETEALRRWLGAHRAESLVTSELGRVEVLRAARRVGEQALTQAHAVINSFDLIPLDRAVQDSACGMGAAALRTLDSLHLASALLIKSDVTGFVSYDMRLAEAAAETGLSVVAHGQADS
ncbi:type II toxin-antitoxin system VapC family toxin [soil metagenome]